MNKIESQLWDSDLFYLGNEKSEELEALTIKQYPETKFEYEWDDIHEYRMFASFKSPVDCPEWMKFLFDIKFANISFNTQLSMRTKAFEEIMQKLLEYIKEKRRT